MHLRGILGSQVRHGAIGGVYRRCEGPNLTLLLLQQSGRGRIVNHIVAIFIIDNGLIGVCIVASFNVVVPLVRGNVLLTPSIASFCWFILISRRVHDVVNILRPILIQAILRTVRLTFLFFFKRGRVTFFYKRGGERYGGRPFDVRLAMLRSLASFPTRINSSSNPTCHIAVITLLLSL